MGEGMLIYLAFSAKVPIFAPVKKKFISMKPFHRKFFYRKADIEAFVALLMIIVIGSLAFVFVGKTKGGESAADDSTHVADARQEKVSQSIPQYYDQGKPQAERFAFDPNTADSTQLLRLGLAPYMVRGIYKYRALGGIYRCAEDFAKVPGLTQKQYHELKPYIRISPDYLPASQLAEVRQRPPMRDTLLHPVKIKEGEQVALNAADTTMLKRVPGIGSYYASAIIKRGKQLGGYVSVDQLSEIDDFPEEAKKYFKVEEVVTVKMNVNKLTVNQMKHHPYMGYYRAKAIVEYRRIKGPLKSLDDLALLKEFPSTAIEQLRPYVEF